MTKAAETTLTQTSSPHRSSYVYVTFIRTTPQKLWTALTDPAFTRQYWFGMHQESEWKPGAPWRMVYPDGRVSDAGELIEVDPPRRLVIKWRNEWKPEMKAEGYSRCVMELEPVNDPAGGGAVKLTITHSMERPDSELIHAVSSGWPKVLSNLKSLLETGEVVLKRTPGH
jgi:uncharacterized protein YndB with AHSA1/START domain